MVIPETQNPPKARGQARRVTAGCEASLRSVAQGNAGAPGVQPQRHMAAVVKTVLVPFWLVGEFTARFRTYLGIGMLTGGTGF